MWLKKAWAAVVNTVVREPVQIAGGFAALIQFVSTQVVPLTVNEQGALNAVVVAVLGFVAAAAVSEEKALPAVAGLVQSVLAVVLSFGVQVSPTWQAGVMAFVAALTAFVVRPQVVARRGSPRGKHEAGSSRMRG